jgi:hypothetical protein
LLALICNQLASFCRSASRDAQEPQLAAQPCNAGWGTGMTLTLRYGRPPVTASQGLGSRPVRTTNQYHFSFAWKSVSFSSLHQIQAISSAYINLVGQMEADENIFYFRRSKLADENVTLFSSATNLDGISFSSYRRAAQLSQQTGGKATCPAHRCWASQPASEETPPSPTPLSPAHLYLCVRVGLVLRLHLPPDSLFPLGSAPPRRRRSCVNAVKQGSLPSHPPV